MTTWPAWWEWELEFSPHLQKRMIDRGFSETDLRTMMVGASGLRESSQPGRWLVDVTDDGRPWLVIVEPDTVNRLVIVITAFAVEQP